MVEKAKLVLANLPKPGPDTTAEVRHEDDARREPPPSEKQGPRGATGNSAEQSTPDRIDTTECQGHSTVGTTSPYALPSLNV